MKSKSTLWLRCDVCLFGHVLARCKVPLSSSKITQATKHYNNSWRLWIAFCLHLRLPVQSKQSLGAKNILVEQFSHALDTSFSLLKNAHRVLFGKLFQKPLTWICMGKKNLLPVSTLEDQVTEISKEESVVDYWTILNQSLYDAKWHLLSPFTDCFSTAKWDAEQS